MAELQATLQMTDTTPSSSSIDESAATLQQPSGSLSVARRDATSSPNLLPPPSPAPDSSVGSPMSSAHANSPGMQPSSSSLWNHQPAMESNDPFKDTSPRSLERDELLSVLEALHRCPATDLQTKLHLGGHLHRMLVEGISASGPSRAHSYRDDFREAGGFLVVIQLISTLDSQQPPSEPEAHSALQIEIFKLALSVLSASLLQHPLNLKAFEATIGWKSLLDAIEIAANSVIPADHIFGSLLGLAVADVHTYSGRIISTRRFLADHAAQATTDPDTSATEVLATSPREEILETRVRDQWTPVPSIVFPYAVHIMLQLLLRKTTSLHESKSTPFDSDGVQIVLQILLRLVSTSRRNQAALANVGLSTLLLDATLPSGPSCTLQAIPRSVSATTRTARTQQTGLFGSEGDSDPLSTIMEARHRNLLTSILRRLYAAAGIPDKDGRKLLIYLASLAPHSSDTESPDEVRDRVFDLLLDVTDTSQEPNTVLFSMAEHGHASLAFSTLRRPFPPKSPSRGFTFVTTFSIERIEPSLPIELLTLFDAQRSLHVQLSIEPGTGHFSYSTSLHPSSPPTRFNKGVLVTGKRYHLVFVHLYPRGGAHMSPARLFIDGELIQEKLAPWPAPSRDAIQANAPAPSHPANPVRAVLGSPPGSNSESLQSLKNMSNRSRANRLVWSLGPTMLLDDAISQDLPFVLFQLGPRYAGNAQDSLGRFVTYRASANINLRLDHVARAPPAAASSGSAVLSEKELADLPLVRAIAGRASDLIPEERLYFVVNAANTATFDRSGAGSGRHSSASATASDPSKRSGSRVVLNQAVPLNREAVTASYGVAKTYGEPVLLVPRPLDEMIWKLGGCAILLKFISDAETPNSLAKTLRLFLELISRSWRLSEDVERCKGYEVLSSLLHTKGHLFNDEIVASLFGAMGIDVSDEGNRDGSVMVNPFLYRLVMLDFELWSQTSHDLQVTHLEHFSLLLRTSRYRRVSATLREVM